MNELEEEPEESTTYMGERMYIVRCFVWQDGELIEESPTRNGFTFTAVKVK